MPDQASKVLPIVHSAFPQWEGRLTLFGGDWLGRQWLIDDSITNQNGLPVVRIIDPEEGGFEAPVPLGELFDLLADIGDELFEKALFNEWRARHQEEILWNECIGLRVPLNLGGQLDIDNLEKIDLEVYWGITAQVSEGVKNLPEGTEVKVRKSPYN